MMKILVNTISFKYKATVCFMETKNLVEKKD